MLFYIVASWTALVLAGLPWFVRMRPESQRSRIIGFTVIELVTCFVGLIVLWRTGWGGAVSDFTFAWIFAVLLAGAGVVYVVLRD